MTAAEFTCGGLCLFGLVVGFNIGWALLELEIKQPFVWYLILICSPQ